MIFYSQGYRIDFKTRKISQTGGLFLKIWPKQAEVYLDSKLEKRTDFFFGSALIENLLPGKYKVLVKKEGYHSWEKVLEIKEKEVTEAKNVVLVPRNLNFTILTKGVEDFWFSLDQKKIILKEVNEKGWTLKLYDLEKNVKNHLVEDEDIYLEGQGVKVAPEAKTSILVDLLNLEFSPDSKKISIEVGMAEQIKHFLLEIDKSSPVLTEEEEQAPSLENIITYREFNGDIYYLDNRGYLFRTDKTFEPKIKISEKSFPLLPETEYKLEIFPGFIFLKERKVLYLFNPDSKSFERFFEPIKDLKISSPFNKLVYFSDYEIWILFLEERRNLPSKKAGEKLFLLRFSEKIEDIYWLNSDYLIFTIGNKIKITEIDERDRINIINLAEFKEPEIFFNKNNKKLYILSKGNLYESEKLLP